MIWIAGRIPSSQSISPPLARKALFTWGFSSTPRREARPPAVVLTIARSSSESSTVTSPPVPAFTDRVEEARFRKTTRALPACRRRPVPPSTEDPSLPSSNARFRSPTFEKEWGEARRTRRSCSPVPAEGSTMRPWTRTSPVAVVPSDTVQVMPDGTVTSTSSPVPDTVSSDRGVPATLVPISALASASTASLSEACVSTMRQVWSPFRAPASRNVPVQGSGTGVPTDTRSCTVSSGRITSRRRAFRSWERPAQDHERSATPAPRSPPGPGIPRPAAGHRRFRRGPARHSRRTPGHRSPTAREGTTGSTGRRPIPSWDAPGDSAMIADFPPGLPMASMRLPEAPRGPRSGVLPGAGTGPGGRLTGGPFCPYEGCCPAGDRR